MTLVDPTIAWRCRRTPRWMSLSLAARGAVEGIVVAMGGRREMKLPPLGLEALASVLGRPWAEVAPALAEAFKVGKLEFDAARNVVIDPSRESESSRDAEVAELRTQLANLRAELEDVRRIDVAIPETSPAASDRARSTSAAAIRSRQWRAKQKAIAAAASTPSRDQLELPAVRGTFERTNANANATLEQSTSAAPLDSERSHAFEQRSRTSASLSGSSNSSRNQREARAKLTATTAMPLGWLEHARTLRPDLTHEAIAKTWPKFAAHKARAYQSWQTIHVLWGDWIEREREQAAPANAPPKPRPEASTAPSTEQPYYRPAPVARPDEEAPSSESTVRVQKVRMPSSEAVAARVALLATMGIAS